MKHCHLHRQVIGLVLILGLLLSCLGCSSAATSDVVPLTVTLLKVGKADAIVVLCGSHAMVLDTGEEDDGEEVIEFLQNHGVQELDAMIITHFDQDHVGGADTILEAIPVRTIYVPDYDGSHTEYHDFLEAAEAAHIPIQRLQASISFSIEDAQVLIEPPNSYEIPENSSDFDNNFSLITTIVHGDNRFVFMGDAEKQRIRQWLSEDTAVPCDFLKVPHHGIYNGALEELFTALQPAVSVICSSKKNPAERETLELLKSSCPHVLETKDGNVVVISNGTSLEVHQERK